MTPACRSQLLYRIMPTGNVTDVSPLRIYDTNFLSQIKLYNVNCPLLKTPCKFSAVILIQTVVSVHWVYILFCYVWHRLENESTQNVWSRYFTLCHSIFHYLYTALWFFTHMYMMLYTYCGTRLLIQLYQILHIQCRSRTCTIVVFSWLYRQGKQIQSAYQ